MIDSNNFKFIKLRQSGFGGDLNGKQNCTFVNLISVRVFEALGLDTTSLVQAREEYKRIQEQKRRDLNPFAPDTPPLFRDKQEAKNRLLQ